MKIVTYLIIHLEYSWFKFVGGLLSILLLLLSGCAAFSPAATPTPANPTPTVTTTAGSETIPTANVAEIIESRSYGITMKNPAGFPLSLMYAYRKGHNVQAMFCFTMPAQADWQLGMKAEDTQLQVDGKQYPIRQSSLVSKEVGNVPGSTRCFDVLFPFPQDQGLGEFSLIVAKLQTSMPEALDCAKAQHKLDQKQSGIVVKCSQAGSMSSFDILQKPATITDSEARLFVVNEGFTDSITGPWVFHTAQFTSPLP